MARAGLKEALSAAGRLVGGVFPCQNVHKTDPGWRMEREMTGRDRRLHSSILHIPVSVALLATVSQPPSFRLLPFQSFPAIEPVSYTHLTLPTKA